MEMVCTVRGTVLEVSLKGELDHHATKNLM